MKRDGVADRGQVIEGAHRHVDLVAHALHVDQHQRRKLFQQLARYPADHTSRPSLHAIARGGNPAQAQPAVRVADRAGKRIGRVGARAAGKAQQPPAPSPAPAPFRVAVADHRLLDLQRGVFGHRRLFSTAAQIAAPRAWPSISVDFGLTLTNTFSTATCSGRCCAITSLR